MRTLTTLRSLPLFFSAALYLSIPGAKLILLERAGHVSWLEAPAPFTQALDAFLAPLK